MYSYPDFPDHVYVELTNICNARCTICATPQMKRPRQIMPFSLFRQIVDECGRRRARKILPFLHGESLLVPGVLDYFRYVREAAPRTHLNLTSNGSKLTAELSEQILQEDLIDSLIFSIDGGDKRPSRRFASISTTMRSGTTCSTSFVVATSWAERNPGFRLPW